MLHHWQHTDAAAVTNSYYGSSRFAYWTYVRCSGSEDRLIDCNYHPIAFSCGQGDYAGVTCIGMYVFICTTITGSTLTSVCWCPGVRSRSHTKVFCDDLGWLKWVDYLVSYPGAEPHQSSDNQNIVTTFVYQEDNLGLCGYLKFA